ncbi:rhodanese-like domain-containing protein [Geomonas sp. RF6]|uniref:rhodanese-like domain-containing protein n=1 Tax=Geomonas sp. RF6 TaxID=2897342 RepID=UPI001E2ADA70|nr:rhodanese-like domain-containing protein [Geomonas sp. RF6]UFS71613.1 rhodanese-like domain-containing protein [Geomonas sp. RF6]
MKKASSRLMTDVLLVFVVAAVLGLSWNHTLLLKAWRGEATSAPPAAETQEVPGPAAQEAVPLPLGLMQVKELYDAKEAVIIDARDMQSYEAGHIKGAVSLPLGEASKGAPPSFQAEVPTAKELIVYCNGFSCHDSMDLANLLIKWGYRTVYVYEGGYPEWYGAGYPISQGRKP